MELWFSDYHTEKVKVSVKVQLGLFGGFDNIFQFITGLY